MNAHCGRLMGWLCVAVFGVLFLGGEAVRAQDEGPALYVAWEFEETNLLAFNNYRCRAYASCPAGTFMLTRFGQFAGCDTFCNGDCAKCTGNEWSGSMARCEHHHGEKCYPAINGTPVDCGYQIKGSVQQCQQRV
jgi:hypothetical protein